MSFDDEVSYPVLFCSTRLRIRLILSGCVPMPDWMATGFGGGGGGVKVRVAGFVSRGSELSIFSTTD
jgi:hypothetical protein